MKLPKDEDKFVVTDKTSFFYEKVVSGVHLEIWGDEAFPDKLFYHVCADVSYSDRYIRAFFTLKEALDYIAQYFTPYQKQEEKTDEELIADKENSDGQRGPESISGVQEETGKLDHADHDRGKFSGLHRAFIDVTEVPPAVTSSQGGGPLG